jgi:hypothetical protein
VKRTFGLVALCCVFSAAWAGPDSLVQSMVNSVSQDSIGATILRLQHFGTRFASTDSNYAAVLYARDRMAGYACDTVYLDSADTSGYYKPSVIGTKLGRVHPEMEYIICAHIDDVSDRRYDSAPGADDNASGSSVVLEACRVFAQHWFNCTVRFACFNCEEGAGPSGAMQYAYEARARGDSILGVFNFDMVGYGTGGHDSVSVGGSDSNPDCSGLLNRWCFAADAYTSLKYRAFLCDRDSFMLLDHWWFLVNGYRALFTQESQRTPKMHSPGDTIGPFGYDSCGVNNLPLCAEATRAAVATLALLAQVDGVPGVQEMTNDARGTSAPGPSVVRGVLLLPEVASNRAQTASSLLDISGRRVLCLRPGANDVRTLPPGVYVIEAGSGLRAKVVKLE